MENQKKQLVINDQLVNYYQFGKGKISLILLHGWRSSAEAWFGVIPSIVNEDLAIYALDMPGFGASPLPKKDYEVADYAEIISNFIDKKKMNDVVLVGHSFGGRLAIKLAAFKPKWLSGLVLVDSAGIRHEHKSLKIISHVFKPIFAPRFMRGIRSKLYKLLGLEDYLSTPEMHTTYLNVITEDLSDLFKRIEVRTLIIWGREDRETPIEDARIMHREINKSKLHIIENAGHFSFVDKPEEFIRSVLTFIKPKNEYN